VSTETASEPETVTPEMLAGIDEERRAAEWRAQGAAARRDSAEGDRREYADRADALAAVRSYLEERLGRPMGEVAREAEVQFQQAQAAYDEAHEKAEAAKEELRDFEGYRRVLERMHAEAEDASAALEGDR
jgi:DNA repair exonuclease SbcCD ATPase subunit